MKRLCSICDRPRGDRPGFYCRLCSRALGSHINKDGTTEELIAWAAARARWFEKRRNRLRVLPPRKPFVPRYLLEAFTNEKDR